MKNLLEAQRALFHFTSFLISLSAFFKMRWNNCFLVVVLKEKEKLVIFGKKLCANKKSIIFTRNTNVLQLFTSNCHRSPWAPNKSVCPYMKHVYLLIMNLLIKLIKRLIGSFTLRRSFLLHANHIWNASPILNKRLINEEPRDNIQYSTLQYSLC